MFKLGFRLRGAGGRHREGDQQAREPSSARRAQEALGLGEVDRQVVVHQAML
jgi:hypothetical protein